MDKSANALHLFEGIRCVTRLLGNLPFRSPVPSFRDLRPLRGHGSAAAAPSADAQAIPQCQLRALSAFYEAGFVKGLVKGRGSIEPTFYPGCRQFSVTPCRAHSVLRRRHPFSVSGSDPSVRPISLTGLPSMSVDPSIPCLLAFVQFRTLMPSVYATRCSSTCSLPRHCVPSRSIAQHTTSSRRATATIAIFFRDEVPRRARS